MPTILTNHRIEIVTNGSGPIAVEGIEYSFSVDHGCLLILNYHGVVQAYAPGTWLTAEHKYDEEKV